MAGSPLCSLGEDRTLERAMKSDERTSETPNDTLAISLRVQSGHKGEEREQTEKKTDQICVRLLLELH